MNTLTSKVTDEQIETAFAAIGCDILVSGEYGEPERFAVVSDSLDDFRAASKGWNRCGAIEAEENALIFRDVAPRRGDQICDLYVVDFGDTRVTCKF